MLTPRGAWDLPAGTGTWEEPVEAALERSPASAADSQPEGRICEVGQRNASKQNGPGSTIQNRIVWGTQIVGSDRDLNSSASLRVELHPPPQAGG